MALSGYMEKGQRHGITCRRVKPKSEAGWYNGKEELVDHSVNYVFFNHVFCKSF